MILLFFVWTSCFFQSLCPPGHVVLPGGVGRCHMAAEVLTQVSCLSVTQEQVQEPMQG
jgi:hypothetical protein